MKPGVWGWNRRLGMVFLAAAWLGGCVTAPETGRRQLVLVGAQEELRLGLQAFSQIKQEVPISRDRAATALVEKVGRRIAAVANLPGAEWEFVLFESQEANAFCLPGGKVGVYTGLLPIARDEAGLATVIGHEVAHAAAHHGAERMSRAMITQGIGNAATAYVGSKDPRYEKTFGSLYGIGLQIGETLPHSRKQEAEADEIGLLWMARAGYDPEAAVAFWQRFADYNRDKGSQTPRFLRTHPLDQDRIANLQRLMPKAKAAFRPVS